MEYYKLLIISGLLLDIVGFLLLAYYNPETFNLLLESAPKEPKRYSKPYIKKLAISFVVLGFILQIIGTILQ